VSASDSEGQAPSSGSMADHLQRYRNYIGDLKRGQSSGISAAFGRASDLLPPEVMEIKAPSPPASPPNFLTSPTAAPLRQAVAPAQRPPQTSSSLSTNANSTDVNSTNLKPHSAAGLTALSASSASASTVAPAPATVGQTVLAPDFDRDFLRNTVEAMIANYAEGLDDPVGSLVRTAEGQEEVLAVYVENGERMYMLSDLSTIDEVTFKRTLIAPGTEDKPTANHATAATPALSATSSARQPEAEAASPGTDAQAANIDQTVSTAEGALLWQIYYGSDGPKLISMADGGIIKRAEGREQYIFSRLSAMDGDIKFFILSGFLVDPGTGNIYLEANEGAYTVALLNNGWQVHQYRSHTGEETYFVTEPMRAGQAPATQQVKSLDLDPATGSVEYETIDGSATILLKSRRL
jgi:hypothetical protein